MFKLLINISIVSFLFIVSQNVFAGTNYVSKSGNHVSPFNSWSTAATNIQDAVDVAVSGDIVLVNDGIYDTDGKPATGYSLTNRVCVEFDILIKSVNGPKSTIIVGKGPLGSNAVRGVYLVDGTLSGFTVSNGFTLNITPNFPYRETGGGGIYAYYNGKITNCVVVGNSAYQGGGRCLLRLCIQFCYKTKYLLLSRWRSLLC